MAQDTLYFPHDYNPIEDSGLRLLVKKHGAKGYGTFWRIIELLHQNADHKLRFIQPVYEQIADNLLIESEFVEKLIYECIETYFLFEADGEMFWSRRVDKNIQKRQTSVKQRSDAGKASAEMRKLMKEMIDANPDLVNEFQRSLTVVNKERKK
jgi:hypothetical protein